MITNRKDLKNRLIEIRKIIKRKYKAFKDGTEDNDLLLEKQYKPILTELRKKNADEREDTTVKDEPLDEPMEYDSPDSEDESPPEAVKASPLADLTTSPTTSEYVQEYFKNPVTQDYMTMFMKDVSKKNIIDYTYGPRYENDTLMVGSQTLDFDKNGNIIIGGDNYGTSEGLYELLFKRVPNKNLYNDNDLNTYKSILLATNAHREGYDQNRRIKANKSTKYLRIIRSLFPTIRGRGMHWKKLEERDIIHWDDPNELIDRLRHITMSTETGNRVHSNEIFSIIEELREAGFIKGAGNSRYKALIK
jgi:hypothetical protein